MTVSVREQLQAQAKSLGHLMSHQPFNPFCRACVEGRTRKKPRRKGGLTAAGEAESGKFGDLLTGDPVIARKGLIGEQLADEVDKFGQDHLHAKVAVVLYDRGTGWVQCYPKGSKTKEDTIDALSDFVGADKVAKSY